ncbi:MAG: hypothetical protein K2O00_07405 [Muribaculaceae bacterium]|nr:hypothetical protein [Muribaculaceae bacterium]
MKKFLYLLVALPLFVFSACNDDDDVPNVDLDIQFSGVTVKDDVIYVVQGEPITIESVSLINNTDKKGTLGVVSYYWDYVRVGSQVISPYTATFETNNEPVGNHLLTLDTGIYVEDYPICFGVAQFKVKIVASADELPDDGEVNPQITNYATISAESK